MLSDWLVVARHRRSRRDLPRPHDRDGRGRQAPEDAERDRARHPARGAHDHLPARDRHAAAVLDLRRAARPATGTPVTITVLVALLVCLIPTTIGGLLSAIGIAGMDRMIQANVIAMSGRAVEAAGDVDVLLLDKTGTITLGNRQATAFIPADGVTVEHARRRGAARLARRRDARRAAASSCSPRSKYGLRERDVHALGATFVPFTAQTRMSGVDLDGRADPQGRGRRHRGLRRRARAARFPPTVRAHVERIAREGGTPLVVADGAQRARRHPAEGHREGRHQGALRRAAPHGHQDGDDHRRQPAHRRRDRGRGRRRRLPRRGHARGEARADPRLPGAAAAWSR